MCCMRRQQIISALRRACLDSGSLRAWAKENDVDAGYVSRVRAGKKAPGPKVLRALGFEVAYRRVK